MALSLKWLSAVGVVLILSVPLLNAAIASPGMGRFATSQPTEIAFDKATALMHASVTEEECKRVANLLLRKNAGTFYLEPYGNGAYRATFGPAGGIRLYDPRTVHFVGYDMNGRAAQRASGAWQVPLSDNDIKACIDLLGKIASGSRVCASAGPIVDFLSQTAQANELPSGHGLADALFIKDLEGTKKPRLYDVHIEFGPKGFSRAYFRVTMPLDENDSITKRYTSKWR